MMIFFWSMQALLVVLALAFIWWPWLRNRAQLEAPLSEVDRNQLNVELFKQRVAELKLELAQEDQDQAAFDALRLELEQNLLQEVDDALPVAHPSPSRTVLIPLGMTLLVSLLSGYMYLQLGSSDLLNQPQQADSAASSEATHDLSGIEAQIAALRARLEAEPDNTQGWFTLGRTYLTLQRYQDAYWAFGKVAELVGEHAEILSQQAQALYYHHDHQLTAEVQQIIDRALVLNPQDPGTLWLLGIAAYDSGQFNRAIDIWQGVVSSDLANVNREGLMQAIEDAKSQLAQQGAEYIPQPTLSEQKPAVAASAASLKVLVELDSTLKGTIAPETTVFVYAQAVTGAKMPLAAARFQVRDLPVLVTLDDSMAMGPMVKLSSAEQVQVRATVSFSGTPGAQSGDLQGVISPVTVLDNDSLIKILINERVN